MQGSGKSWLCRELARRTACACYDLDELWNREFVAAAARPAFLALARRKVAPNGLLPWKAEVSRRTGAAVAKIIRDAEAGALQDGRPATLVFAGMGHIRGATDRFVVRMSRPECEEAYRRLLRREYAKVTGHAAAIRAVIDSAPLDLVGPTLHSAFNIAVYPLHSSFLAFLADYRNSLLEWRGLGFKALSQAAILAALGA